MFGDLNNAEVIGNVTSDIQVKYTGGGSAVTNFSVATNRSYKNKTTDEWVEEATFHNIVVWGKQAEMLADRARKGTKIYVSGRLQTRTWDDQDGKKNYKTEIVADKVLLLDRYERGPKGEISNKSNNVTNTKVTDNKPSKPQTSGNDSIDPDDLPF